MSTKLPNFTQSEYEQARKVIIVDYLLQNGYVLQKSGKELQLKNHDSLKIRPTGEWYWHSWQIGGKSPIELVKQLESVGTVEAVKRLCRQSYHPQEEIPTDQKEPPKPFKLPNRNQTYKRVFAYLNHSRCIDGEIISQMMKAGKIYESSEVDKQGKIHHNAIFVSHDQNNVPRHAAVRGTLTFGKPFRRDIEGGDKSYPFVLAGKNSLLYVFESAIDALSHATLFKIHGQDWQEDHRIALNGLSNDSLRHYLAEHPHITNIVFCLDNDYNAVFENGSPASNWGQMRAAQLHDEYSTLGYNLDSRNIITR